jgi:hypothetical protein
VQYAIHAGLWTGLVRCGGLQDLLRDSTNGPASLRAVTECLAVVEARGVDLADYPDARVYLQTGSHIGMLIAGLMVKANFMFNAKVRRASAHGLGDPAEIAAAYRAVLATGQELGIPMTTMLSFSDDITAFAAV